MTRHIVRRTASDPAPPLLPKLALDDGNELFSPLGGPVAKISWPERQELQGIASAAGLCIASVGAPRIPGRSIVSY
ncbi:hypothetical protein [Hyphomicrobium sp.]|uniref:hypothetical protein n=1 Tax=Hyphomicrobium sp. TaxID=82 RepID=UPI000FB10206|nr:hypothetical protein [Hyphomicrobium sp.]MBN9247786.1 hypothetical protein [Hyphomicrobium sp.]RUP11132.1 MAG: hypothetical protein EKK38_01375 [Hyphomicrobium sp.]